MRGGVRNKEHMSAYRHWKRSLRHPLSGATDLADPQEETLALQSALDGLYWTGVDAEQQELILAHSTLN